MPFFRTLQCEETKGIILSRIMPALKLFRQSRDVTVSVSSIISALISCNFIIKNYVNRKITSYIYLLIFTYSLWLHVKHFIALKKRESVRRIFFVYLPMRTTLVNTSTSELEKHEKYDSIGDKERKNMCTHKTSYQWQLFNLWPIM